MDCLRNIQVLVPHPSNELVAFALKVTDSGMIWATNETDIQIKSPLSFKGECDGSKSATILTENLLDFHFRGEFVIWVPPC